MIYLDHAATTVLKPRCVAEAVAEAMTSLGNSGRGAHGASLGASRLVYETRALLSDFFGADGPEQVAFTANATMALNMAAEGLVEPGDHVITTGMEHNSVLRPLYRKERQGAELTILPADKRGCISLKDLEQAIRPETKAFFCTHASNVTGNVNDLARAGEICRRHGILFVADVSQTGGILPVDMKAMNVDVLCFTGHKGLLGPQGTGGICLRRGIRLRPLLVGGSGIRSYEKEHPDQMPEALEAGTLNVHGIAGLHAAVSCIRQQGREKLFRRELSLMQMFYERVSRLPGVIIYGDFGEEAAVRAPIVSLNLGQEDSAWTAGELSARFGIETRAGAHCAPLMHRALGTEKQGAVRFSFSHMNTEAEVEAAADAVEVLSREAAL
ncbi:MAG: aminotransferase class V-fold PLP-dependent enzyme [Eubacteriales bacterium]|nr:aminotransferase class V-fold PLP-dependent enzyme [Eubacteriales bacterium]